MLRDLPGIDLIDNASRFGEYYTIHGIEGNDRFLVLIDGHRLNPPAGTFISVGNSISVRFAKRIEILYGPASVMYGADAFSGIINIISRDADKNGYIAGVRAVGSNNANNAEFCYINKISKKDDWQLYVSGKKYFSDGVDLTGTNSIYNAVKEYPAPLSSVFRQPIDDHNIQVKIKHRDWEIGFYRQKFNEGNALGLDPEKYVYNEDNIWNVSNNIAWFKYSRNNTRWGSFNLDLSFTYHFIDPSTQFLKLDMSDTNTVIFNQYMTGKDKNYKAEISHYLKIGKKVDLISGIKMERISSIPPYANDYLFAGNPLKYTGSAAEEIDERLTVTEDRIGFFHQFIYNRSDKLKFIAGVRFDISKLYENSVNPRVALVYKPNEKTFMKAIYGTAFQAPSLFYQYEQFGTPAIVMIPNKNLGNQKLQNFALDIMRQLNEYTKIQMLVYYNTLSNLITRQFYPDSLLFYNQYFDSYTPGVRNVNIGKQTSHGVDLRFTYINDNKLSFDWGYSYINASYQIESEDFDMPRIAENKIWIKATYKIFPGLVITPKFKWVGKINTAVTNTEFAGKKMDGYSELSLYAYSANIVNYLTVYVCVNNLLNSSISHGGLFGQAAPAGPNLPLIEQDSRSYMLGLHIRL